MGGDDGEWWLVGVNDGSSLWFMVAQESFHGGNNGWICLTGLGHGLSW